MSPNLISLKSSLCHLFFELSINILPSCSAQFEGSGLFSVFSVCTGTYPVINMPLTFLTPAKTRTFFITAAHPRMRYHPNAQKQGGLPVITSNTFPHACSQSSLHSTHCGMRLSTAAEVARGTLKMCQMVIAAEEEYPPPVHFPSCSMHTGNSPLSLIINPICCSHSNLSEELPLKWTQLSCEIMVIYG